MSNFGSVALLFKSYSGGVILPHPNCLTYIKKLNGKGLNYEKYEGFQ